MANIFFDFDFAMTVVMSKGDKVERFHPVPGDWTFINDAIHKGDVLIEFNPAKEILFIKYKDSGYVEERIKAYYDDPLVQLVYGVRDESNN